MIIIYIIYFIIVLALNLIVFYIFEKKNIYINQFGIRDTSRTADVFFI